VPLLWGRARPSSEGGISGSDRGAHLDNIGLGIFAYEVARVQRIDVLRDARVLYLLACDVVIVRHAHSPYHAQCLNAVSICGASSQSCSMGGWRPYSRMVSASRSAEPVGRAIGL
jgi:hypothetical protein